MTTVGSRPTTRTAAGADATDDARERPLVQVRDLRVDYRSRDLPETHAVRGVSFDIAPGEFVGLLGESGCGKSTLGNAMLHLLDKPAYHAGGQVLYDGRDLWQLPEREIDRLRWREIATVFQSSMNALNPVMRVAAQFEDVMAAHGWDDAADGPRQQRIAEVLASVDLDPARVMRAYPHELSGGMRQRVVLALALVLRPRLVILDEPTTGLDVVVQRQIVNELRSMQAELGFSVLFISHDLGTVLEISDRVLVMYAGELVETRTAAEIATDPLHPYTRGLLGSFDDPRAETVSVAYIPGRPPSLTLPPRGCPFAPRCPAAMDVCRTTAPPVVTLGPDATDGAPAGPDGLAAAGMVRCHLFGEGPGGIARGRAVETRYTEVPAWSDVRAATAGTAAEPLVVVEHLHKTYHRREGWRKVPVHAVKDVSFTLWPGRVRALVGQSGSGKSTIAKILTGTERASAGTVTVGGEDATALRGAALARHHADVQMVFQDPFSALNPTKTVGYALSRPLRNHLGLQGHAARARAVELLESVGLYPGEAYVDKLPHQLSGGQRQRVVIARAMAPEPKVLIADEPISMLDVSIRAEILELLATMVRERDVAMLYITHDLLSARLLADDTMVMRRGEIVEDDATGRVVRRPEHDYTRLLLDSIPNPFDLATPGHAPTEAQLDRAIAREAEAVDDVR
ncbi:ABC transporter ATP-binding protein [Puerhibacterium sp. TATVAM-FAB25]|uniref:ABC transporter ATP-binding protein n=1 Tax=Puerhibacterium sp. TATVAM-FAB25 TaxID=3093699 RepID=UPI00397E0510